MKANEGQVIRKRRFYSHGPNLVSQLDRKIWKYAWKNKPGKERMKGTHQTTGGAKTHSLMKSGEPGSGPRPRSSLQSRERPDQATRSFATQPVMRTSVRRRSRRARAASGRMASSCSCTSISTICSFVRMSGRSHWRESSRSCRNASRGPAASW